MKKILILCCSTLLICSSCNTRRDEALGSLSKDQQELILQTNLALLQLPDVPHQRNRNRELGDLAEFVLQEKNEALALKIIESVDNWRNAQLKVKLAILYLNKGQQELANPYVKEVEDIATTVMAFKNGSIDPSNQPEGMLDKYDDFRIDRIKVALAQYYWEADSKEKAKHWSGNVLPSEQASFIKHQADCLAEESYDASLAVNRMLATGETFEGKIAAIEGFVLLYELYFQDVEKRQELKALIDEFSPSMPVMSRIEWLHRMSIAAFNAEEVEMAKQIYTEACLLLASGQFRPRLFFPLKSSNIITACKLNMHEDAKAAAVLLEQKYDEIEEHIFNLHRADVLCAVGEAYAYLGEMARAEKIYLNALRQAVVNPNSRPRVEDLSLIVQSLLKYDVPLSAELKERINTLLSTLGEPW